MFGATAFGLSQADAYFASLETACQFLADNPEAARLRTEITPPVRCHPHGAHMIIYSDHLEDVVVILRARHAREDWEDTPV